MHVYYVTGVSMKSFIHNMWWIFRKEFHINQNKILGIVSWVSFMK